VYTKSQSFVVTDPNLPDNPIVYASQGFLDLTGYARAQVVGRNCRFLQGPDTDSKAVTVIREGLKNGCDTSVCLLNYKVLLLVILH
jgi:PAS domain S-box-containing protein